MVKKVLLYYTLIRGMESYTHPLSPKIIIFRRTFFRLRDIVLIDAAKHVRAAVDR